jgi:aspartyl-tRNA(Asn)/glutamyl-tRNA(Gln) amidotransferase subunit C
MSERLDEDDVRKIAKLARLSLTPEETQLFASQLTQVLLYVNRLAPDETSRHTFGEQETTNRLAEDEPGSMMRNEDLMRLAPVVNAPFIRVPKVIDDGGSS